MRLSDLKNTHTETEFSPILGCQIKKTEVDYFGNFYVYFTNGASLYIYTDNGKLNFDKIVYSYGQLLFLPPNLSDNQKQYLQEKFTKLCQNT